MTYEKAQERVNSLVPGACACHFQISTGHWAWISKYIHAKQWDEITHAYMPKLQWQFNLSAIDVKVVIARIYCLKQCWPSVIPPPMSSSNAKRVAYILACQSHSKTCSHSNTARTLHWGHAMSGQTGSRAQFSHSIRSLSYYPRDWD